MGPHSEKAHVLQHTRRDRQVAAASAIETDHPGEGPERDGGSRELI